MTDNTCCICYDIIKNNGIPCERCIGQICILCAEKVVYHNNKSLVCPFCRLNFGSQSPRNNIRLSPRGGIFQLLRNGGRSDRLLVASDLLRVRMDEIRRNRLINDIQLERSGMESHIFPSPRHAGHSDRQLMVPDILHARVNEIQQNLVPHAVFLEEDIEMVMQQAHCNRPDAISAMEQTDGDMVASIIQLTPLNKI